MATATQLKNLQQKLEQAVESLPLAQTAQDIVHGEGSAEALVMFIGEAPGFHETQQRRPFVGRSGKLLRQTLVEVGLPPESVYISNIVKARPPENRDPTPQEIQAYKPFLDEEISVLSPKLIVTLGRFSMQKFLPSVFISQVHGRLHRVTWSGKQQYVLPMYHPAAALRSGQVKSAFIADCQKIPKILTWLEDQANLEEFKQDVTDLLK
jgi:uracil-DNA glycosylase